MQYEEALREWGALRIESRFTEARINSASVSVAMDFDEGYACCGGSDPDCYCSFAESPSARVQIRGIGRDGKTYVVQIDHYDFDFATILGEILDVAGTMEK